MTANAVQRQTVELTQGQLEAGLWASLQVAPAQAVLASTEALVFGF